MKSLKKWNGMRIEYTKNAKDDIEHWKKSNKDIYKKIKLLIEDIQENPYKGLGLPKALKSDLNGVWSRRISQEHRLLYYKEKDKIIICQCRYHY